MELCAAGTLGDIYLNICRIIALPKQEIIIHHYSRYVYWFPLMEELYSIIPNLNLKLYYTENPIKSINESKLKFSKELLMIKKPNFIFSKNISKYNLPKKYVTVNYKSGKFKQAYRTIKMKELQKIIDKEECVVIVGDEYGKVKVQGNNIINLCNKTSLLDAMEIVKKSERFYGFQGIMSFVATSYGIPSWVYWSKGSDYHAINVNIIKNGWGNAIREKVRV